MSKDPYKYFRLEARELLDNLSQGILDFEKNGLKVEQITNLLRYAHTLKGAARVVKQLEISQNAHTLEGLLLTYKSGEAVVSKEKVSELLSIIDKTAVHLRALQEEQVNPEQAKSELQQTTKPARVTGEELFDSVRVDISEMDGLLEGLTQATVQIRSMRFLGQELEELLKSSDLDWERSEIMTAQTKKVEGAFDMEKQHQPIRSKLRNLFTRLDHAEKELKLVREKAGNLRLLPASTIFSTLQRSVRDAAESLHKSIDFESSGGGTRLDAHILRILKDSLIHVVRNAVAHGIESEDERTRYGKQRTGKIKLQVERRGNKVAFIVSDDGRGIDVEAIRQTAMNQGLITGKEAKTFDYQKAIQLILGGGVSTAGALSEVTGRGVGLGVLQDAVSRMKGSIEISSEPHVGMAIDICVPITVESLKVITVRANDLHVSLPLDSVLQTLKVSSEEVARSSGGDSLVIHDRVVPFQPLTSVLSMKSRFFDGATSFIALVVQASKGQIALGVEQIERVEEITMRPLPAIIGHVPLIAGACLDGDGNPQLILDPQDLDEVVFRNKYRFTVKELEKPRVMVIDDSLTTRMLEKAILDSAGYDVTLVNSGEEALEQARRDRYEIFIVDVEMPGISGFEFVAQIREDPVLKTVPAVLVTSRTAEEDKKRGKEVGAQAYIPKSEFDENVFLKVIRRLVK
ncbi:MAG: response regulator [Deltaproteobacteria bacterium]|nr:response regulator [Deltaproteobacteria bacterium]